MRSEGNGKRNPLKVTGGLDFGIPRSNPNPDCKSKLNSPGLQHLDSPCGRPSHTSSQSYLHSPSEPCKGSFSRSKVRKVRVTSMWGGTMMMKVHSRLWGYLSGKPGDSITPDGVVKFLEQSEPGGREIRNMWRQQLKHMHLQCTRCFCIDWNVREWTSSGGGWIFIYHTRLAFLTKTYWCKRKRNIPQSEA